MFSHETGKTRQKSLIYNSWNKLNLLIQMAKLFLLIVRKAHEQIDSELTVLFSSKDLGTFI